MKRPGLAPLFPAAILFVFTGLCAAEKAPAPGGEKSAMMGAGSRQGNRRAAELLQRYDTNADGKIDDDERAEAQEAMLQERMTRMAQRTASTPGGPEAFRARLLEMFDRNKDGRLEGEERVAAEKHARESGLAPTGELAPELLQRFDRNANGRIDLEERPALQAFIRERLTDPNNGPVAGFRRMRPQLDRNDDGKIDEAEMNAVEDAIRPRIEAIPILVLRYDNNGDGKIDDQEWIGAREEVQRLLNVDNPAGDATPAPDKERLDRVAEELKRRRDERAKSGK